MRPGTENGTVYLYRLPVDMRKAINGLVAIVEAEMELDPFSASLFVFCNRKRTLVKMVAWEGNGFVLWMKRLEKSRFAASHRVVAFVFCHDMLPHGSMRQHARDQRQGIKDRRFTERCRCIESTGP